ncbi:alpha-synuclein isoform NACP140 [Pimephales promelas]|nr:alpha-synuclein isoform NACP140 [Pimephales promelas]
MSFHQRYYLFTLTILFLTGTKTKEGVATSVNTAAQKTTEQVNLVGESAVAEANEISEKAVEGLESVVVSTGLVKLGELSKHEAAVEQPADAGQ